MNNKIKSQEEITEISQKIKVFEKKVGFTNGCFDILHSGHVKYLSEAKKNCDILIIGVNSDSSVKRLKGDTRPVNVQEDRIEVLSALEFVDFVTIFEEDTPEELIKKISPDLLFKGGDWKEDDIAGAKYVKENGGQVKIIPFVEGYSTTGLIKKLKD